MKLLKSILWILLLSLCAATAGFGQGVKQVAILDIIDKNKCLDDFDKMFLRGKFTTAITKQNGYAAYTRTGIASIHEEQKFRLTGVVSDSLCKEIGSKGVDFILKVEAMKKANDLAIVAEIISVKTTQIVNSAVAKSSDKAYNGDEDKMIDEIVSKLLTGSSSYIDNGGATTTTSTPVAQSGFVDLGLSVKWASCNLGASTPEGYGDYYAWGETSMKVYNSDNCKAYGKTLAQLQSSGIIDALGNLTRNYDVARCKGMGRMPTLTEIQELKSRCTWTWTTQNGVNGYKVTGPNGNSIFLPAAGCRSGSSSYDVGSGGYYWSSTAYDNGYNAYYLGFDSSNYSWSNFYRDYGFSVRPVTE